MSFSTSGVHAQRKKHIFRYEACWDHKKDFKEVIKKAWKVKSRKDDVWEILKEKIHKCQQALTTWNGAHIDQIEKVITQKTKLLEELQNGDGLLDLENIHNLQQEVNELMEQDDVKWRQQAKENWLKYGFKNSKYFHACANQRR